MAAFDPNFNSDDVEDTTRAPISHLSKTAGQASIERMVADAEGLRSRSKTAIENLGFGFGPPGTKAQQVSVLMSRTISN